MHAALVSFVNWRVLSAKLLALTCVLLGLGLAVRFVLVVRLGRRFCGPFAYCAPNADV